MEQLKQGLTDAVAAIDSVREIIVSLQEKASQMPAGQDADTPDYEAEVNRRVAAKMRFAAEQLELETASEVVSEVVNVVNVVNVKVDADAPAAEEPETASDAPAAAAPTEEQPADPGFSVDESDHPLAETAAEAQRILGLVEQEEYAKEEPDFKRLHKYQRHATQTEAANRSGTQG